MSRQATSPTARRASRAARSLNGTTAVVAATSTCGPSAPGRGTTAPDGVEHGQRLVDGAVVAPVEDGHPRPAGQVAGEAQHEPVGVRGRDGQLPGRQPEAAGELLADPGRVLAGQHRGRPGGHPLGDRGGDRGQGVARHRTGVAEAQVDVLQPVDVDEPAAGGGGHRDRERAGPPGHPRHRHAGQQAAARLRGEGGRAGSGLDEPVLLPCAEVGQAGAIDHGCNLEQFRRVVSSGGRGGRICA